MSQIELTISQISATSKILDKLEAEWRHLQQCLKTDIENLNTILSDLKQQRQSMVAGIDYQIIDLYQELKKRKTTAVVKVDQGTCRGCQILLSTSELQRVRSGNLVRCNSCGRILFLD